MGADILVHGVYSGERVDLIPESWKIYMSQNHTSTYELSKIASKAQPKVLVLYHILPLGTNEEGLLNEIQTSYSGEVFVGNDLDIF